MSNQAWAIRPERAAYFVGGDDGMSTTFNVATVLPFHAAGESYALDALEQVSLPHGLTKTMPLVVGDSLFP